MHKNRKKDAVREAKEFGIDVKALVDNLKRTPAERIRRHRIALNTVMKFRKAKKKITP